MSYARFGWDGSDVYVIGTLDAFECFCPDQSESIFRCKTRREMIGHLKEHRAEGLCVPQETLDRLKEEIQRGDPDYY